MTSWISSVPRLAAAAALAVVVTLSSVPARADVIYSIVAPSSVTAGSTGNTLELRVTNTGGSPMFTAGGFTFGITSSQSGVTFTSATTSTSSTYLFNGNSGLGPQIDDGAGTSMTGGDVAAVGGTNVNGGDTFGLALISFDVDNSVSSSIKFTFVTSPQQNTLSTPPTATDIPITTFLGATTTIGTSAVPEPSVPALACVVLALASGRHAWRRRTARTANG